MSTFLLASISTTSPLLPIIDPTFILLTFSSPPSTKQGVYAILNHDNLRQNASMWFVSLKVLEATFCVEGKAKSPTRNPVYVRETPVNECRVCPRRQNILGTALQLQSKCPLYKRAVYTAEKRVWTHQKMVQTSHLACVNYSYRIFGDG